MSTRQEPVAARGQGRFRVLVLTVVHDPEDARIRHRQIGSLLRAGWEVTYAAPFAGYGRTPSTDVPGLRCVDVTRARGRRRLAAQRSARRVLRDHGPAHDVVLVHDPELVPTVAGLALPPVVWDVHEDPVAALDSKEWLPGALRRPAALAVRGVERLAERRHTLLLADEHYRRRFRRRHAVVPNTTWVPDQPPPPAGTPGPDGAKRVVYVGSLTVERGAAELVEVGRRLRALADGGGPRLRMEVLGPAHGRAQDLLRAASDAGDVDWSGPVPNDEAMRRLEGALAGLSLLHDRPNFRPSMPTKVVEYLAHGVPAVTSPLRLPARLVERTGAGVVVPFGTVDEVADAVLAHLTRWAVEPAEAARIGALGYAVARRELDWAVQGPQFVAELARVADGRAGRTRIEADPTADAVADLAVRTRSPRVRRQLAEQGGRPGAAPAWTAALGRSCALQGEDGSAAAGLELLDRLVDRVGHAALPRPTATLWAQLLLRTGQEERLAELVGDPELNLHPLQRWTLRTDLANPHRQDPSAAAWVEQLVAGAGGSAAADRAWVDLLDEPHRDAGLSPLRLRPPEPGGTAYRRLHAPADRRVGGDLVSVVMSAYQPDQDLVLAATSVLEQSWEAVELLVVDDASPPGGEELLEAVEALDPRVQVVRAPRNGGTYAARNLALDRARGRWMTFQDSDDWTHPQRLEVQARHLHEHPGVLANRTRALRAFPDLSLTWVGYPSRRLNASSLMVDLGTLRTVLGGFDAVRKSADIELPLRLRAVREDSLVDLADPWPLAITQLRADSLSRSDTVPGRTRWDRAAYRDAFTAWHTEVAAGTSSPLLPRNPRPFPLPTPAWGQDPGPTRAWEVVVLGDLRETAPGVGRVLELARRSGPGGAGGQGGAGGPGRPEQEVGAGAPTVALAHVETPVPLAAGREPMSTQVTSAVRRGEVGLTGAVEVEEVGVLLVADPATVLHLPELGLRPREVVVAADEADHGPPEEHVPHREGSPSWTGPEVEQAVRDLTGLTPRWQPDAP